LPPRPSSSFRSEGADAGPPRRRWPSHCSKALVLICTSEAGSEVLSLIQEIHQRFQLDLAEREGFEPPIRLPVCRISSAVRSTTLPPLRRGRAQGPRSPRNARSYIGASMV